MRELRLTKRADRSRTRPRIRPRTLNRHDRSVTHSPACGTGGCRSSPRHVASFNPHALTRSIRPLRYRTTNGLAPFCSQPIRVTSRCRPSRNAHQRIARSPKRPHRSKQCRRMMIFRPQPDRHPFDVRCGDWDLNGNRRIAAGCRQSSSYRAARPESRTALGGPTPRGITAHAGRSDDRRVRHRVVDRPADRPRSGARHRRDAERHAARDVLTSSEGSSGASALPAGSSSRSGRGSGGKCIGTGLHFPNRLEVGMPAGAGTRASRSRSGNILLGSLGPYRAQCCVRHRVPIASAVAKNPCRRSNSARAGGHKCRRTTSPPMSG